jgi:uncharacterized membrane protein
VSLQDFVGALDEQGVPADVVDLTRYLFTEVLDGRNAYLGDGVQRALGREPRDFTEYARDAAGRHGLVRGARTRALVVAAHEVALFAATLTTGLVAGLFFTFAHAVMPGLHRSGDPVFVAGFRAIDEAIDNPWMGMTFAGAPLATAVAAGLQLRADERPALGWTVAALGLYGAMLAITVRVHLPLNRQLEAAGGPDQIPDLPAVRARFESRWVRWNVVRAALSTAAFGSLGWALLQLGGR